MNSYTFFASARLPFLLLLLLTVLGWSGVRSRANPTGGRVMHGAATLETIENTLRIHQATDKAILHWEDFSISAGEITEFIQPGANAAVLNRVISGNPSQIFGQLQANGKVLLINPNGILVGAGGRIDTAGFIASTLDVPDADFLAGGDLRFSGNSNASVANYGTIVARDGDVFLIGGAEVTNAGAIEASNGTGGLAAGQQVLVKAQGEERVFVEVGSTSGKVDHSGVIQAAAAELKAAGSANALAVNTSGIIKATGVENRGGKIYLSGGTGGAVNIVGGRLEARKADGSGGDIQVDGARISVAPEAIVDVSGSSGGMVSVESSGGVDIAGTIEASGHSGPGGQIRILGQEVILMPTARLEASGNAGGGEVLIGGDYQGSNPEVANSQTTYVAEGASISADSLYSGGAGRVIVWADDTTQFDGDISAAAFGETGDGGFVEVSGKERLGFGGHVNVSSAEGEFGKLLLDPGDAVIDFPALHPAPTYTDVSANLPSFGSGFLGTTDVVIDPHAINGLPPGTPIDLQFQGVLDIAQGFNAPGPITFTAAGVVSSAPGPITVLSQGDQQWSATAGSWSASNVNLDAGLGAVEINATAPGSSIGVGDIWAPGGVELNAATSVTVDNIWTNGGNVIARAGTGISASNIITVGSGHGGDVTLTSQFGFSASTINTSGKSATMPGAMGYNAGNLNLTIAPGATGTTASSIGNIISPGGNGGSGTSSSPNGGNGGKGGDQNITNDSGQISFVNVGSLNHLGGPGGDAGAPGGVPGMGGTTGLVYVFSPNTFFSDSPPRLSGNGPDGKPFPGSSTAPLVTVGVFPFGGLSQPVFPPNNFLKTVGIYGITDTGGIPGVWPADNFNQVIKPQRIPGGGNIVVGGVIPPIGKKAGKLGSLKLKGIKGKDPMKGLQALKGMDAKGLGALKGMDAKGLDGMKAMAGKFAGLGGLEGFKNMGGMKGAAGIMGLGGLKDLPGIKGANVMGFNLKDMAGGVKGANVMGFSLKDMAGGVKGANMMGLNVKDMGGAKLGGAMMGLGSIKDMAGGKMGGAMMGLGAIKGMGGNKFGNFLGLDDMKALAGMKAGGGGMGQIKADAKAGNFIAIKQGNKPSPSGVHPALKGARKLTEEEVWALLPRDPETGAVLWEQLELIADPGPEGEGMFAHTLSDGSVLVGIIRSGGLSADFTFGPGLLLPPGADLSALRKAAFNILSQGR